MNMNVDNTYENEITLGKYTARTFGWMFLGLLITFGISFGMVMSNTAYLFVTKYSSFMFVLLVVEIIMVIVLAARIRKLSAGAATGLFLAYAVLNGVTLSAIFLIYSVNMVFLIFGIAALIFGVMAVVGYFTRQDLSNWRKILFFGVAALALFWLLSLFINLTALEKIICFLGIGIFLGCTAYDTQKIKSYYYSLEGDEAMLKKASVVSALQLYLDFINIFIYLLRLLSGRK